MNNKDVKVSIIICNYNSEDFLPDTLNRLLKQTYKNIEIILVNDGSIGPFYKIKEQFQNEKKIKIVESKKNIGLYSARLLGLKHATGKYVINFDADDRLSADYVRLCVNKLEATGADMGVTSHVLEMPTELISDVTTEFKFDTLEGKDILDNYFMQRGQSMAWHMTLARITRKEIFDKAMPYLEKQNKHLIMTEDYCINTVIMHFIKKMAYIPNCYSYYNKHDEASTKPETKTFNALKKYIEDLTLSFTHIDNFMKNMGTYEEYKKNISDWKMHYAKLWNESINRNTKTTEQEKKTLKRLLDNYSIVDEERMKTFVPYYGTSYRRFDERLDQLKEKIISEKTKVVSFDIFDTLLFRPFYVPTDLFTFLNTSYNQKTNNTGIFLFSDARINAEKLARKKENTSEILLDDIYEELINVYDIDRKVANELKKEEIALETKYLYPRKTSIEILELANYIGKKVIITTDMYLPKEVLINILKKNKIKFDKIYVSGELKKSKAHGNLYSYILNDLKVKPEEIVHIGDNYQSDVIKAKKAGMWAYHLPKPIDMLNDPESVGCLSALVTKNTMKIFSSRAPLEHIGYRSALAVSINKYFDNPYKYFEKTTTINNDVKLLGSLILGLNAFGVTLWIKNIVKNYSHISFVARDGYFTMLSYERMKKYFKDLPDYTYIYNSRKSLLLCQIEKERDFYQLHTRINLDCQTPLQLISYLENCTKDSMSQKQLEKDFKTRLQKEEIEANEPIITYEKFKTIIDIYIKNYYDKEKHMKYLAAIAEYFKKQIPENTLVFDVGYSLRPEVILKNITKREVLDVCFLNASEKGYENAREHNIKLRTLHKLQPALQGYLYEFLNSNPEPSTIGYNVDKKGNITVKFEEAKLPNEIIAIVNQSFLAAADYVDDMYRIFKDDLEKLYCPYEQYTVPFLDYITTTNVNDLKLLGSIVFEDELLRGKKHHTLIEFTNSLNAEKGNTQYYYDPLYGKSIMQRSLYYLILEPRQFKEKFKRKVKYFGSRAKNKVKNVLKSKKK